MNKLLDTLTAIQDTPEGEEQLREELLQLVDDGHHIVNPQEVYPPLLHMAALVEDSKWEVLQKEFHEAQNDFFARWWAEFLVDKLSKHELRLTYYRMLNEQGISLLAETERLSEKLLKE